MSVEERSIPGWHMGRQIAICHPCKESREESSKDDVDGVDPEKLTIFDISCAFRGVHVYRSSWKPMIVGELKMEQEYRNMHDPFAISICSWLRGKSNANCLEI